MHALNLLIAGNKSQLSKRLQAALQGTPHRQQEPSGRVQEKKSNSHAARSRPVDRIETASKPDSDVDDRDKLSSVSSLDLYEDQPNINTLDNAMVQQPAAFTAAQLPTIRKKVPHSVAEVFSQCLSFHEPSQPLQGLGVTSSSAPVRRPGSANPLGLQPALDKGTEDKILWGENLDFSLFLPNTITRPQVPELQVRFDDSGPGSSSNMTMVRKRKPVIDTFQKWLDAYTTYMIVIVTAYTRHALELLKYQQSISCVTTKFKGLTWLTYDEQIRGRAARDLTIDWGQVELELWTVTFSGLAKPHYLL